MSARKLAREMDMYFQSGNAVPVEKAYIKTVEWQALYSAMLTELDAQQALLDAITQEFCNGDMTPEQLLAWARTKHTDDESENNNTGLTVEYLERK